MKAMKMRFFIKVFYLLEAHGFYELIADSHPLSRFFRISD